MFTSQRLFFKIPATTLELVQSMAEVLGLNSKTCPAWASYNETYLLYSKAPDAESNTGICVGAYTSGSTYNLKVALMYQGSISSGQVISTSVNGLYELDYMLGKDCGALAINKVDSSDKARGFTCFYGTGKLNGSTYGMYAVKSSNAIECVCNGIRFNKTIQNNTYTESDVIAVTPLIHTSTNVISDNLYITNNFPYLDISQYFALGSNEFITMWIASAGYERLALKLK